jgi:diacylglycerol kinase family enzyme
MPVPGGALKARSDAELARIVEKVRLGALAASAVRLLGGDLWRTLGGASADPAVVAAFAIDVGVAAIDGEEHVFVAHAVARGRSWWFGPVLAVCNAQFIGHWDVAPRSHPGDGRLDVVEMVAMPLRQRWLARRRLATGTHVPHPAVAQRRVTAATFTFPRPRRVWLDGVPAGRASELSVAVEPGRLTVCV